MIARAGKLGAGGAVGGQCVATEARNARGCVCGLAILAVVDAAASIGHALAGGVEVEVGSAGLACACALVAIVAVGGGVGGADPAGNAGAVAQQIVQVEAAEADAIGIAGAAVCIQAGHAGIIQSIFAIRALHQAGSGSGVESIAGIATRASGTAGTGDAIEDSAVELAALTVSREQEAAIAGLAGGFSAAKLAVADGTLSHTFTA